MNRKQIAAVRHIMYVANIRALKEYLIDRNSEGEKPELIVESPYANPETGLLGRYYLYWDHNRGNSLHLFFQPVTTPAKSASSTGKLCSVIAGIAVSICSTSQILMHFGLTYL
jgi:hypothetical protein